MFATPVATFKSAHGAAERDINNGLVLTVECDASPQASRERLQMLLGPPTVVVVSGGTWTDPATGACSPCCRIYARPIHPTANPTRPWLASDALDIAEHATSDSDCCPFPDFADHAAKAANPASDPPDARQIAIPIRFPLLGIIASAAAMSSGSACGSDDVFKASSPLASAEATREFREHARLKEPRRLAMILAGADGTAVPLCHPLRWSGSWHRKGEPRLAYIVELNSDAEIELGDVLDRLRDSVETAERPRQG